MRSTRLRRFAAACRHAFSVDRAPFEPTEREAALIDGLVAEVARRGLTTAAVVTLETVTPLGRVGGQALRFLEPVLTAVADADGYRTVVAMLERPGAIAYVVDRLERPSTV
ncbi:MAG: hypothetical protein AAF532_04705 [Planctomycetota bacterium]